MQRSSLIEFQGRLAERLQAAQSTQAESRWLAVMSGGERLLLPLTQSGEIASYEPPTPLPHAAAWFVGLISMRGAVCGVVDLAAFLGGVARAGGTRRMIQFSPRLNINAVLLVDQLEGLRTPSQFVIDEDAPPPAEPWLGVGLRDAAGQRWRELNLAALAASPRFLQVV
jgi:twitching motility protein PilI